MKKIILTLILAFSGFLLVAQTKAKDSKEMQRENRNSLSIDKKIKAYVPPSVFSHIEVVIDSNTFEALIKDTFITKYLGFAMQDTMKTTHPVYSLYLWGHENFLHFNPDKGWFNKQFGSAYVIFQSTIPGIGKALEAAWKQNTNDTLMSYDFKGPDFVLTEIIFKEPGWIFKSKTNHLVPMLSSYSVPTYKKWNLPDTSETGMTDFINSMGMPEIKNRIFKKISSLSLSITKKEVAQLSSMLTTIGYKKRGKMFYKQGQPNIRFVLSQTEGNSKVQSIELLLTAPVKKRTIVVDSKMRLELNERTAVFFFN
jgi:hypothetical protein